MLRKDIIVISNVYEKVQDIAKWRKNGRKVDLTTLWKHSQEEIEKNIISKRSSNMARVVILMIVVASKLQCL